MEHCVHCEEIALGYARLSDGSRVCHPDEARYPDCYRRVTVYGEKLGVLNAVYPLPHGVQDIRR